MPRENQREVEVPAEAIEAGIRVASEQLGGISHDSIVRKRVEQVIQAAAPVLCAQERERIEAEQREERLKRLLGKDWPAEVVLMRDAGAKSSPPWTWWMEAEYDHDKYEAHTYVPAEVVTQAAQQERERVKEALLPLLDQLAEAISDYRDGKAGSGTWLNRIESEILTTLDEETD